MDNLIVNSPLGNLNRIQLKAIEKYDAKKLLRCYQLEEAKAFWNYQPKKPYEFWKKKESRQDYIFRNMLDRLEYQKSLQK